MAQEKSQIEKEKEFKQKNIIINFADYDFEDFIETLVEMATSENEEPLSVLGVPKATQMVLDRHKISDQQVWDNFKKLLKNTKVNDLLRYQKFFDIQDKALQDNLSKEIIDAFVCLVNKEDLMHALEIKHLISQEDFDNLLQNKINDKVQSLFVKYIQAGEMNLFENLIKIFDLQDTKYIPLDNTELALKGISSCLDNSNMDGFVKIKDTFKLSTQEIFRNNILRAKAFKLLGNNLEQGEFKEFSKKYKLFQLDKKEIIIDDQLRESALKGIDKNLKTSYNSAQAILIKEFFNFSMKELDKI